MWKKKTGGAGAWAKSVAGKASCVVDCSARSAALWWFVLDSREGAEKSIEERDHARLVVETNNECDNIAAIVKSMPMPLQPREFVLRALLFRDGTGGGECVVALESLPKDYRVDYGSSITKVRGSTIGVVRFSPILGNTQCKVTYSRFMDAAGVVPSSIARRKIGLALSNAVRLWERCVHILPCPHPPPHSNPRPLHRFERSDQVDALSRSTFAAAVRVQQVYSESEIDHVVDVTKRMSGFDEGIFELLDSPDSLVKMHVAHKQGESVGIVRATTVREGSLRAPSSILTPPL
jgi:hypothetical protein